MTETVHSVSELSRPLISSCALKTPRSLCVGAIHGPDGARLLHAAQGRPGRCPRTTHKSHLRMTRFWPYPHPPLPL